MFENSSTQYASARRSDINTIEQQKEMLTEYYGSLNHFYDAISEIILIVNSDRQIVFFNSVVPALLEVENPESIYGMRPGEALGCVYACLNPGGCGTSKFCSQCGAVNAILSSFSNQKDLQECRMMRSEGMDALDLLVRTTPLAIDGQMFSIMAISDISHEKRRRTLERVFFHDIMNTVVSINLFAELLVTDPAEDMVTVYQQNLLKGIRQLVNELTTQKVLLQAENNKLETRIKPVDGCLLIRDVADTFANRFNGYQIKIDVPEDPVILKTDRGLLHRVLSNMVLNALEAGKPEDVVRVSCGIDGGYVEFCVHNEVYIEKEILLQIFQRSFSTKGSGRGLGTYSMKLLSERYLNGNVTVTSSPNHGTTFAARYPI